jgi:hypothetical protein
MNKNPLRKCQGAEFKHLLAPESKMCRGSYHILELLQHMGVLETINKGLWISFHSYSDLPTEKRVSVKERFHEEEGISFDLFEVAHFVLRIRTNHHNSSLSTEWIKLAEQESMGNEWEDPFIEDTFHILIVF